MHRSIQLLGEYPVPQLDVEDPIQQDNTQEAYKEMLLYQIAQLTQLAIYSKLDLESKSGMVDLMKKIKQSHGLDVACSESEFWFKLPKEFFELRYPKFVDITCSLQSGMRLRRD